MDHVVDQAQTKLFTIHSRIDNWPYEGQMYNDVAVTWHVRVRQEPPVPYKLAIADYEPGANKTYAEFHIDGLFTEEEANLVCEYLSNSHGMGTELKEVCLPVSRNSARIWSLPVNSGWHMYPLFYEDPYDLPFEAVGYYDISMSKEWYGSSSYERNSLKSAMEKREQAKEAARLLTEAQGLLADEHLVGEVMSDPSKRHQVNKYMAALSSGVELGFPDDIRTVGNHYWGVALMMQSRFLEMESMCIVEDREGLGDCPSSAQIRENESRESGE